MSEGDLKDAIARLEGRGLVVDRGGRLRLTTEGRRALSDPKALGQILPVEPSRSLGFENEGEEDLPMNDENGARRLSTERLGSVDERSVFVVHGRNESLRRDVFSFLRSIGLQPIEWSKAVEMTGKPAPYIGEILSAAFANAVAVLVLFTGDDEARLRPEHVRRSDPPHERELSPQARPNVLFEAGLAFGMHPDRTVLVEVGRLRPFSDLSGVHVIRLSDDVATRQGLAQRLRLAGCAVDLSGTDWHDTGEFAED